MTVPLVATPHRSVTVPLVATPRRSVTVPLVETVYMVTARPRSNNTQKIVDFMLSPEGQKLVEDTGYVPIGTPAPAVP